MLAAIAAVTSAVILFCGSRHMTVLQLQNLEALADGEGGTPVRSCVFANPYGSPDLCVPTLKCGDKTDEYMIYPCPDQISWVVPQSHSLCTVSSNK